jgi:hypothetical protein
MLLPEDNTVTAIQAPLVYFNFCLIVQLDSFSCSFSSISYHANLLSDLIFSCKVKLATPTLSFYVIF